MIAARIKSMMHAMQFLVKRRRPAAAILVMEAMMYGMCAAQPAAPVPAPPPRVTPASRVVQHKLSPLANQPVWRKLESFRKVLTAQEFEAAMRDFYADGSAFTPPWQLGPDSVSVNTGDPDMPTVRIDFRPPNEPPVKRERSWRLASELPPLAGRPPLSDAHIAIDPGHIGGAFAKMEERFLSFRQGESIQEGDLTLVTAQVLKARLEALGAVASLVRNTNEPVTSSRPPEFNNLALAILKDAGVAAPATGYDGLSGDAKVLTVQWQSEKLFYRVSEIRERAKKVNQQLKPDLVLCLHYNAEAWGDATQPQFSPVNHMHVMVNGCYAPLELEEEDVRFEMFSRLFSRLHEAELPLAESIGEAVARTTGLPPYVYTTRNARRTGASSYVYARNLLANRLYECPVVYLEPYVMNHEDTYRRLLLGHYVGRTLVNGKLQSSAIEDYVNGIVDGLVRHYQSKRAN